MIAYRSKSEEGILEGREEISERRRYEENRNYIIRNVNNSTSTAIRLFTVISRFLDRGDEYGCVCLHVSGKYYLLK